MERLDGRRKMRRQSRSAYYITPEGTEREQIEWGMRWIGWSIREHEAKEAWLVTPSYVSLRGAIQEAMGDTTVTALLGKSDVTINGVLWRHYTELTLPYTASAVTILAAYPVKKLLDSLDNLAHIVSIAVVPANTETAQTWITSWQAKQVIDGKTAGAEEKN